MVTNRRLISDPNKYFRVTTFLKRYSVGASRMLYGWCICAHALSYLTSPKRVIRDFSWKKISFIFIFILVSHAENWQQSLPNRVIELLMLPDAQPKLLTCQNIWQGSREQNSHYRCVLDPRVPAVLILTQVHMILGQNQRILPRSWQLVWDGKTCRIRGKIV